MTQRFQELVVGGVLVAPILSYAVAALLIIVALRPFLHLVGFTRYFSNPPIAELSLYVAIFGVLTLFV